jgi:cytochrome c peroxidase
MFTNFTYRFLFICLIAISLLSSCEDEKTPEGDLTAIPYSPTPYHIKIPDYFPEMPIPADNPMTEEGVDLGRHIFFDNILSGNQSMSCSSCHNPKLAFTDGKASSTGIDGVSGHRSSMSLINIGFTKRGLFWDGRAKTLEEQALLPVTDPIELHANWTEVENRFQNHDTYPTKFRMAFGIKNKTEIDKNLVAKALAQYQRALLSVNSRYDLIKQGQDRFTDLEFIGFNLYTDSSGDDLPDAECHHCHQLDLATADDFFNNGLQESADLYGFKDLGKGGITKQDAENGKMRAPTLRNILLTAPYMHDGSKKTIEEVLDHYNGGSKNSPNKDPLIRNIELSSLHKKALIAFLKTLTDTSYLSNPLLQKPQ